MTGLILVLENALRHKRRNVMNELVKVVEQDSRQLVDARDLHGELGVKTPFAQWINRKIKDYGYVEGADFFSETGKHSDSRVVDYRLTVGTAKELATAERCEKSKEIRKQLIAREEAWNEPDMVIFRAVQLVEHSIKHYGPAIRKFEDAAAKLLKDKNMAPIAKSLASAANDLMLVMDPVVIKSDAMQRELGGLMQHYGLDREALDDIVFGIREKLGSKAFYALSEVYESGNKKLLSA